MTTKSGNLSLQEKRRIEELMKCSRERKRLHIVEKLNKEREELEKPFNEKIEKLQRQSQDIQNERTKAVIAAGYGKIHERGCWDTHPELDAFDAETNKQFIALWKTAEPNEKSFVEEN